MESQGWFLLGAPWDSSGSGRGEEAAPQALRAAGLSALVGADRGDAECRVRGRERDSRTGVLALEATLTAARALADAFEGSLGAMPHRRPLVVGGDCSILLGIVPALRRRTDRLGLWLVDGHPDHLDGATSDTGETADMELAVLTGTGAVPLVRLDGPPPMLRAEAVVLAGHRTRGLDAESAAEVAGLPPALHQVPAEEVLADPGAAGRRAADLLADVDGAWLHLDVDVLDPEATSAVTYPQPGGPGWDALERALAPLARDPRLLGLSVADYRPDLDPTGDTGRRLVGLLDRLLS